MNFFQFILTIFVATLIRLTLVFAGPTEDWIEQNKDNLPSSVKFMTPNEVKQCDSLFVYSPIDTVHLVYDLKEIFNHEDIIPKKRHAVFKSVLKKKRESGEYSLPENIVTSIDKLGFLGTLSYPVLDYIRNPKNAKAIVLGEISKKRKQPTETKRHAPQVSPGHENDSATETQPLLKTGESKYQTFPSE